MLRYQMFQIPDLPFFEAGDPLLSLSTLGVLMAAALAIFIGALLGTRQLARQEAKRKASR